MRFQTMILWSHYPLQTGTTRSTIGYFLSAVLQQLHTWRKPRHVTVPDNYHYMTKVNNAVEFMFSTVKKLDADELKRVFFNSHPYAWKRAFEEIHGFPEDKNNTTSKILEFMQLKAGQALESEHRNREMQRRESRQTRSSKRKSNNNDNEDKNPKKPRKISPEKKLSSKEYNDLCAKLSKSDPNDTCTLRDNHKSHKIKDCNNLKRWKERQASNKNTTESNAIQMFDEDSTTSKESTS